MYRVFPTTRSDYRVGKEVTWEWNDERQWGPTWYRDDEFGVMVAWNSSVEFVGRQVEDLLPG